HPSLGRKVAVKVLNEKLSSRADALGRFFNEARTANEIHSAHIVEVLDFGQLATGQPYIVMEWLDGRSLSQALQACSRMPIPRALRIARQIAKGVGAAHARSVVHRDLKPENVFLIERDGIPDFVKVLDFGIAKGMEGSGSGGNMLNSSGIRAPRTNTG